MRSQAVGGRERLRGRLAASLPIENGAQRRCLIRGKTSAFELRERPRSQGQPCKRLAEWPHGEDQGRGAAGEPRPPRGRGSERPREARRRARVLGSGGDREDPRFPEGQGPAEGAARRASGATASSARRSRATSAAGSGTRPRTRAIRPVSQPELDYDLPTSEDEPFSFTAEVSVQPAPRSSTGAELEVPSPSPRCPRSSSSASSRPCAPRSLSSSPSRAAPAKDGDVLVVDLVDETGEASATTSSSSARAGSSRRSSAACAG